MPIALKVLDISHHNTGPHGDAIDFAAIAAYGIKGIIHKSSQGLGNVDATYVRRRSDALAAGLLWGAYHFADASDPVRQVQHFIDAAAPDDTTLMALDYEPNGGNTMSLASARIFLNAIESQLGRKAVLYSGNLIKEQLPRPDSYFGSHRLWLAHYNDNPKWPPSWSAPWLHQFSGDGVNNHGFSIPGVDPGQAKKLDMDSYNGNDDTLQQEWAS